jgi:hypothetical protein
MDGIMIETAIYVYTYLQTKDSNTNLFILESLKLNADFARSVTSFVGGNGMRPSPLYLGTMTSKQASSFAKLSRAKRSELSQP